MLTDARLKYLGELIVEGRNLKDYENSPIKVFLEAIDELRTEVLRLRKYVREHGCPHCGSLDWTNDCCEP